MKTTALLVAVLTAAYLKSVANSQEDAAPSIAKPETVSKVQELQQQRIATLKNLVDSLNAEHRNGRRSFDELIEANVHLLNAELETASADAERIRLHEDIVKQFTSLEEFAKAAREAGRGFNSAVLKAKARRLEAEISLERAKGRGAK